MDEKRIEQVLEIENQAQALHDAALREADQMPKQADPEGQALIEKARQEAETEARQLVDGAKAEDETKRIISQAEEETRQTEKIAMTNFDRAVTYVLHRVIGKE